MSHTLTPFITAEQIQARIEELGEEITKHYTEADPLMCICVLKGAFLFFSDVIRQIKLPLEVDFVRLASYGAKTARSEQVIFSKDLEVPIEGKDVLIIEDIVDTGHSMDFLLRVLKLRNPRSLKICALIDKHERREVGVSVDFPGFKLDQGFIVGYGLDYAERYRELDAIYEMEL